MLFHIRDDCDITAIGHHDDFPPSELQQFAFQKTKRCWRQEAAVKEKMEYVMCEQCPCEDDIGSENPERVDPKYADPGNEIVDDKIKILPLIDRRDAIHDGLTLITIEFRGLRQVLNTNDRSGSPHEPGIFPSSTQIRHTGCKQEEWEQSRRNRELSRTSCFSLKSD